MSRKLYIHLEKLKKNTKTILKMCSNNSIDLTCVTKVYSGDVRIVKTLVDCGVNSIGDSYLKNLKTFSNIDISKIYLKTPSLFELDDILKYSDISFHSSFITLEKLDKLAYKRNIDHGVIIVVEGGDLREGIPQEMINELFDNIANLRKLNVVGIATNMSCYGGTIPTVASLEFLREIRDIGAPKYNLDIVSGGNSSLIPLIANNHIPTYINNVRIGEGIALGRETSYGKVFGYDDTFILEVEVIESYIKDSAPSGQIGMDAFGRVKTFSDLGPRRKLILNIGEQDIDSTSLFPLDRDIHILGSSSDHLIVDGSDSKYSYKVGDTIKFKLGYSSLLRVMNSKYIEKIYLD